jgi:hypothetical protein
VPSEHGSGEQSVAGLTDGAATPADRSAPPALFSRHWRRWLETEHLALAVTLAYLFLAAVGMLHRGFVLLYFRINLLDYAEPSDLLLAALRDPLIVLVCIAPIPLVALYFRGAHWLRNRYPGSFWTTGGARGRAFERKHRDKLYVASVILWALAFSLQYAGKVARDLRAGTGRRVQVDLITGSVRAPGDTLWPLLLGTTQKYVFLYDNLRQVTTVVPVDNVAQIRYDRRRLQRSVIPSTR